MSLTNSGRQWERVDEGVCQAPGRLARVGVDTGFNGSVELVLELDEPLPGRAFPIRLVQGLSLVPEGLDEVSADSLDAWNQHIELKMPLVSLNDMKSNYLVTQLRPGAKSS